MPFISSTIDPEQLTLTAIAQFDATPERVWQLWADARQLERWWGPPGYPSTFSRHDFSVPGKAIYFMTSPEGERYYGWWSFLEIEEPTVLRIEDGFGDEEGNDVGDLGSTTFRVTFDESDGGTRMTTVSQFASSEQLEQMAEMGMEEGLAAGIGQIDALLAEDP